MRRSGRFVGVEDPGSRTDVPGAAAADARATASCHSEERTQFDYVIPSERSESRNLHLLFGTRSLRRDFHAEAQRCAEAQRTALGVELLALPYGSSPAIPPKNNFGVGIQPFVVPRPCSVLPILRGSA